MGNILILIPWFLLIFLIGTQLEFENKVKKGKKYQTKKGEKVQSRGELMIANWLFDHEIKYKYDKTIYTDFMKKPIRPDFYIPGKKIYIEYFGMWDNSAYRKHNTWKIDLYKALGLKLIKIYPKDLGNLNYHLHKLTFEE
jgi:hypothetical protein